MKEEWTEFEKREGLKSQLLEEEARKRGYPVERLTFDKLIVIIKGKPMMFKDMNGPFSSIAINEIVDDKHLTRQLLKQTDVSVPDSKYIKIDDVDSFITFANTIVYPVVLKPNNLSRGQGVYTHIDSDETLKEKLALLEALIGDSKAKLLIEKQFIGFDFRFFIVDGQVLAVTKRARANVTGDGKKTVLELIHEKNELRKKDRDLQFFLIPTDPSSLKKLYREGNSLEYVPEAGQQLDIRDESNIASGGEGIDFTDTAHEEYKQLAIKAVNAIPGIHYAGVDVIAKDITQKPTKDNYVITEVEFSPGPVSMFPWKGQPRDMAGPILDFYEKHLNRLDF
ncbi:ATP-binding protein [Alkalibacterium sp. MB6]|uniref:ATP-binding protein n=1 Tax=Alkalibacterium sp. MB6 TaxID=2081965 RepID=UPI001379B02D|nr:hypothetical protein [Alkalibacterium sp. MB6]